MGCIVVLGAPGVGKSTVLEGVRDLVPIKNYGNVMFEIAKKKYNITHRDELRKLPIHQQEEIQELAAEELAKIEGRYVLDTHGSIETPKGYLPGIPFKILIRLPIEFLVLIEAPVHEILERRDRDKTRMRDHESPELLKDHMKANKHYLFVYSALSGAPAKIIVNRNGQLEKAQQELREIIQSCE